MDADPITYPAPPPGAQEAISAALVASFPARDTLNQMLVFGLGRPLDSITGHRDSAAASAAVVAWASAESQVPDLIGAARRANGDNPYLAAVQRLGQESGWLPWTLPDPPPAAVALAAEKTAILDAFRSTSSLVQAVYHNGSCGGAVTVRKDLGSLETVVTDLILQATAHHVRPQLLDLLHAANPGNLRLRALVESRRGEATP